MLTYKKIDLILQIGMFLFMGFFLFTSQFNQDPLAFITLVVILGSIQLLSMVVHLFATSQYCIRRLRRIYYILVLTAFFAMAVIFTIEFDVLAAVIFTLGTVAIAVYYSIVCALEIKQAVKQASLTSNADAVS
jgi:hypothetical protein